MTETLKPAQAQGSTEVRRSSEESAPALTTSCPAQLRYLRIKRFCDIIVAALALLVLAVPMFFIAGLVLLTMGSPVVFRQERITRGGRLFQMAKFRSMHAADPDRGRITDEQRLTRTGKFLRATSLDELPSLFNILRGEMSVIGPRPLTADYLERFSPEQMHRHDVRAGLTGLAQTNGRNRLGWDDRIDLDLSYVRRIGPVIDLIIFARTLGTLVNRRGITDGESATMADFPGPLRSPRLIFEAFDEEGNWRSAAPDSQLVCSGRFHRWAEGHGIVTIDQAADSVVEGLVCESLSLLINHARAQGCEWLAVVEDSLPPIIGEHLGALGFERPRVRTAATEAPPYTTLARPRAVRAHPIGPEAHHLLRYIGLQS